MSRTSGSGPEPDAGGADGTDGADDADDAGDAGDADGADGRNGGGDPLLRVRNLTKHYPVTRGLLGREVGRVRAVDGIDFELRRGETVGLVGESGCGKSTAATTLLRLEEPTGGEVRFDGESVTDYDDAELKRFRRRAAMVFQDPSSSFDPRMTVGESVAEPLLVHGMTDGERRRRIVADALERVGLSAADADRYPHELSGGQKQRVGLARGLVVNPSLLVADEPVSALDVSVQAEILSLLAGVQEALDLGVLFISHDLAVVREVCDRVAVMYLGEIVETAPTGELFADPNHPYTRALLSSIPRPDPRDRGEAVELTGDVPDPADPPPGCRFHTRCPEVIPPEGFEFERAAWRGVMDLRVRLHGSGIGPESIRAAGSTGDGATDGSSDDDAARRALRERFDIPTTLSDPAAESVLSTALDEIVAGDDGAARDRLERAFRTPCRAEEPTPVGVGADREVACHLHGPASGAGGSAGHDAATGTGTATDTGPVED